MKDKIQELYGFTPNDAIFEKLEIWKNLFIEYNSHTNLMSKNDIPYLFEKHVLDSISLVLIPEFKNCKTLLDVGTGGGFPSLILSIFFENIKIYGIDSVNKKVKFLQLAKENLNLVNFEPILGRVESIAPLKVDFLVSRAVSTIDKVWEKAGKHLRHGGYFVSYKAQKAQEEAKTAQLKYKELKNLRFFTYNLPLSENYTRKLVVFEI